MNNKKTISLEELPDILTAQDIADYLKISRRRVYEYFQIHPDHGGILNFEAGEASKRAEKDDLIDWIKKRKEEKLKQFAN
ncbi:DNA-binding protein [Chengkuizengella sp. SCS-71B]|uniref:DNA-binding protein n=1 Tax=Chengkuizengella sp. SCS-71B TaxID=3115290 RepID=UPI0032C23129